VGSFAAILKAMLWTKKPLALSYEQFFCPASSFKHARLRLTDSAGYRGPFKELSSQAHAEEAIGESEQVDLMQISRRKCHTQTLYLVDL